MSPERRTIAGEGVPPPAAPYSHAVVTGGLVFLSGQLPVDPATGAAVDGGFPTRVRQVLANLDAVLTAMGLDRGDVVRCTVYLTDMTRYAEMNALYRTHFGAHLPARTCIGVTGLALGADIEIDAVAERR